MTKIIWKTPDDAQIKLTPSDTRGLPEDVMTPEKAMRIADTIADHYSNLAGGATPTMILMGFLDGLYKLFPMNHNPHTWQRLLVPALAHFTPNQVARACKERFPDGHKDLPWQASKIWTHTRETFVRLQSSGAIKFTTNTAGQVRCCFVPTTQGKLHPKPQQRVLCAI
jgi:hypothetical protein